jgi:hypothetical protein
MKTKHLVNELRILLNNSKPIRNYNQIKELVNIIDQSLDIQVKEEEIIEEPIIGEILEVTFSEPVLIEETVIEETPIIEEPVIVKRTYNKKK